MQIEIPVKSIRVRGWLPADLHFLSIKGKWNPSGGLFWGVFYYIEIIAKNAEFYDLGDYMLK